jgi:hypothetical protein
MRRALPLRIPYFVMPVSERIRVLVQSNESYAGSRTTPIEMV